VPRSYDAPASRLRLLDAAHALFSEHGFDGTTTRAIAERAGVDAALIARYFGSKEKLYIAAVAVDGDPSHLEVNGERDGEAAPTMTPEGIASWLLDRTRDTGPGPVMQALVRSETAPEIRAAAAARLEQLFIEPLAASFTRAGVDDARLRAETVVFMTLGLVIGRAQPGSALSTAEQDELVRAVGAAISVLA
jgi:AcrR family transcriptional regulator